LSQLAGSEPSFCAAIVPKPHPPCASALDGFGVSPLTTRIHVWNAFRAAVSIHRKSEVIRSCRDLRPALRANYSAAIPGVTAVVLEAGRHKTGSGGPLALAVHYDRPRGPNGFPCFWNCPWRCPWRERKECHLPCFSYRRQPFSGEISHHLLEEIAPQLLLPPAPRRMSTASTGQ